MSTIAEELWEKAEPQVFVSRDQFMASLAEWDLEEHQDGDFVTIRRGPEFHIESLGTGCSLRRRIMAAFLGKIIAEHGYAMTRTPHDDERQHRFNKTLGFEEVGCDIFDIIYRIEKLRGHHRAGAFPLLDLVDAPVAPASIT